MKRAKFCLRLNEDIYEKVTNEADKLGISTNAFLTMIIIEKLSTCESNKH
jgi:predicted HicB family RNase H-like nuclease